MLDFGFYNMDCMEGMKQFPDYRPETEDRKPARPSGMSRADDLAELRKRLRSGNSE
jgi:hypothetical protein